MAEPHLMKFTISDIGNPNIHAYVPETQVIRQPAEVDEFADSFTPVLKVTKTETTFTKGDKKLQKVTVSEEVPPSYLNPVFSEVQSEVILTQPVRDRVAAFNDASIKEEPKPKSKTKIPIKKFKETVNKISQRRSSKDNDRETEVPIIKRKERKSAIPKLNIPLPNPETYPPLADEEFDKIFEEIVDKDDNIIDVDIEATTIDDPVSLEYSFDEIAQAYDKDELKPIEIINSKVDEEKTANEVANVIRITLTPEEISNDKDKRTDTKITKPENFPRVTKFYEVPVNKLVGEKGIKPMFETNRFEKTKDCEEFTKNTELREATGIKKPAGDISKATDSKPQTKINEKAIKDDTKPNDAKKYENSTDFEKEIVEVSVNNNSKIPLGRFKSVQEVKVPKNSVRRRSLKSAADDDVVKAKKILDDTKLKRDDTDKKVKKIVLDQNKSKNEKEAKAKHKELVRNILKADDGITSSKNICENKTGDKPESPNMKSSVKGIEKMEDNITIEGDAVQYNKNETSLDVSEEGSPNIIVSDDIVYENDKNVSKVTETIKRVVSKLKSKDKKDVKPEDIKENVIKEINSENTKLTKQNTVKKHTVIVGDPKPEIIEYIENPAQCDNNNSLETPESDPDQMKNVTPEDINNDVKEPLHIYEKYTDLPPGSLEKEPPKKEVIKRNYKQKELRLKKLAQQFFDDASYKEDKIKAEMTPVNTPIDNKTAFDDINQRSFALVKNAVDILKESDDHKAMKSEATENNSYCNSEKNEIEFTEKDTEIHTHNQKDNKAIRNETKIAQPIKTQKKIGAHKDEKCIVTKNKSYNEQLRENVEKEIMTKAVDTDKETPTNNSEKRDEEIKSKIEVPKKKSVLSKIAMFERNEPIRKHEPKPKAPRTADDKNTDKKPKIVDKVLKTRIIRDKSDTGEDILIKESLENTAVIPDEHIKMPVEINLESKETIDDTVRDTVETVGTNLNKEVVKIETNEINLESKNIENNKDLATNPIKIVENKQVTTEADKNITNKLNVRKDKKVEGPKDKPKQDPTKRFEKKPIYKSVENLSKRYENLHSNTDLATGNDDKNYDIKGEFKENKDRPRLYRAKSLADIELGEVLVGKVELVVKNIEILSEREREKKQVISVRERPRKRSVADKIAIFEKKIIAIDIDDAKPQTQNQNSITENDIEEEKEREQEIKKRIDDLLTAKLRYKSVENIPHVKLNDGTQMPVLALGTALLERPLVKHVVCAAIDLGYRAIDTAYIYGNEKEVGEGIRAKIADGTVKREDLYIMSKLWSTFHRPDLVEKACNDTLGALGLDYLDLFMIHNPMSFKEGADPLPKIANVIQYSEFEYLDAWHAMEDLSRRGLIKSIGVSNFNADQIDRVLDKGRIKPVVNQVECQPYLSQHRLSAHCRAKGIALSCYGVLGSKGTPSEHKSAGSQPVIEDVNVRSIAKDLGVTPARVLIRYQLEKGNAVVTKCSSSAHLKDILDALDMKLTTHEMDVLDGLNRNQRNFNFKGMGDTHRNYPFKKPF